MQADLFWLNFENKLETATKIQSKLWRQR